MTLKELYSQVFCFVSTVCISPGRQRTWRTSCLIGVIYGLAVVASLSLVGNAMQLTMTSVEVLVVAWLVTATSSVVIYRLFRDVSVRGEPVGSRNPPKAAIVVFAGSVVLLCGLTTIGTLLFLS